ncbi:F0F1 ATP synthase subunit B [soil metagenome]
MEVLGKFGINPVLLVAQIVNFLIILFVIKKYALKPILQMLKNREKTITEGLQQAEEARKLLEETSEKERDILRKAQTEAKQLLDEAKKHREDVLHEAEMKTKAQTDKMLLEAKEQITIETRNAEKRLSGHISELAITLLEKSSQELFTGKEQNLVVDRAIKTLKKTN